MTTHRPTNGPISNGPISNFRREGLHSNHQRRKFGQGTVGA